jgi:alkanesulfonate monooxygenase SsuD/methylene tetrahydromethanopterin reductase-like flavin-dependent oxidoreductase (luciferase family)
VPRFGEAIDILQLLFAKDPADYCGRFYRFDGVSFQPKPTHGRIRLWLGAGAEPVIRRATRFEDAWINGPLALLEVVKAQMRVYRAALQEHGRDGTIAKCPIRRDVFIAENRETALKIVEPTLKAAYRGVSGNPLNVLIVRGPQDLVDKLEQLRALGTSHMPIRLIVQTQEHILRAIQIIGEQVIPKIS